MELTQTWFNTKETSSFDKLLGFIENLPSNLEQFVDPNTSNLNRLIEQLESKDLTYNKVTNTFNNAKIIIDKNLLYINRRLKIEKIKNRKSNVKKERDKIHKAMVICGLDGDSLDLKLGLLNKLWLNVMEFIEKATLKIINFSDNGLVKLIRKFLSYLNSLLSSILSVFPFIESIKEFKDVLEGFFNIAEDLK